MSTKYLIVPNTGQKLTEGDVVMISRYPGTKWVLHCGWYTYYNYQYSGWYFSSIPNNTVLPVDEDDLQYLTVISTNMSGGGSSCDCDCNHGHNPGHHPNHPGPKPPGPHPPGPLPAGPGLSPEQAEELDSAWISVDTIVERNLLNTRILPDGKVVRVNNTEDGEPKYFVWNKVKLQWDDMDFGFKADLYLKKDIANETYATKQVEETVKQIQQDIKVLQEGPEWQKLSELVGGTQ